MTCCEAIMGVIIPPISVLCRKGPKIDFLINLILYILTIDIGAILHNFVLHGIPCCTNILCLLLPPVGAFVAGDCCDLIIGIFLTLLGFLPGVIYAYHVALRGKAYEHHGHHENHIHHHHHHH